MQATEMVTTASTQNPTKGTELCPRFIVNRSPATSCDPRSQPCAAMYRETAMFCQFCCKRPVCPAISARRSAPGFGMCSTKPHPTLSDIGAETTRYLHLEGDSVKELPRSANRASKAPISVSQYLSIVSAQTSASLASSRTDEAARITIDMLGPLQVADTAAALRSGDS